jgi:hypothetical protein
MRRAPPGRKLVEAFHWRYHRSRRVKQSWRAARSARRAITDVARPIGLMRNDIRWRWDLAGGR